MLMIHKIEVKLLKDNEKIKHRIQGEVALDG